MQCHSLSTFQVSSISSIRRDNPPAVGLEAANRGASSPEADVYAGGKIKYLDSHFRENDIKGFVLKWS